jgi:NTE family protein
MPDRARPERASDRPKPPARRPSLALALGGGGARGLAHIVILEALDEMGIKPRIIAGTSIGAIFGAAYASGLSAAEIRAHTELVLGQRLDLVRDLFAARAVSLRQFWNMFATRSALLDAKAVLDIVMPSRIKRDFSELPIPLKVVASDFYAQEPVIFDAGALRPAVAASMALPVIFQPVMYGGRALIDGGLTNPLPFDLLTGEADIIVAVDVSGAPVESDGRDQPTAFEALWATSFIFERSIVKEKLRWRQPDIYIDGGTSHFQVGEFWKFAQILAAAAPAKERFKAQLSRVLAAETLPIAGSAGHENAPPAAMAAESEPRRRLLGARRRKQPAK